MALLKEALTYEQQIERLQKVHNLKIADTNQAKDILKRVNYYRLSAYGIGMAKEDNPEEYKDGITLEHIYRLYVFDGLFRNALTYIVEFLEVQLRTQISNYLALKYGPESYMQPELFQEKYLQDGMSVHDNIVTSFKRECMHQKNSPMVKHHEDKYEGHYPVWVAVELFTFGNLSSLYSIMQNEDMAKIADLYKTNPHALKSWILALVEIRNICAHYGRLYNMPLKQMPKLYSNYKVYRNVGKNKIFPAILTIKRMLFSDNHWNNFRIRLESIFEEYADVVCLPFIGFPPNWKEILAAND